MLAWYAWAIARSLAPNATQDAPGRADRESATLRSTAEAENGLMRQREDGVQRQLACDTRMFRDQQDGLRRWLVRRRSKVDKGLRKTRSSKQVAIAERSVAVERKGSDHRLIRGNRRVRVKGWEWQDHAPSRKVKVAVY
jgi:hypothetical protein